MSQLTLYLFGAPRIAFNGGHLHIQRRKALALLAYLAVTQTPHRRDALATLLWPDFDQTGARHNLRRTLSALHQTLHHAWLEIDRTTIRLPARPDLWVDVVHFDHLLARMQSHPHPADQPCDECLSWLDEAAQLYAGEFLAGFTLADSPGFDEWQAFETERLRLAYAGVLARLGEAYRERGEYGTAIHHARRWVALDSLHEPAHRLLMRLYAEADQEHDAIRQYELCRQLLQEELGAPPAAETTALYEQIRHRQPGLVRPIRQPATLLRSPRTNLPTQTTLFIGRAAEMVELKRLLLEQPGCRLLNLVGPGGIGKTRLALATAAQILDVFPDGAFFVALTPISDVEFIVAAIAEALRFNFHGKREPRDQLLDYLRPKRLLLVVDNFEHLLAGANLLSEILHQAPTVVIVTTARERLNLQEEWMYAVEGLSFPAHTEAKVALTPDISDYSAVALFVQRARQTVSRFTPTAAEMAEIVRICQLVEGMPLGLELAAPWIRSLSCAEIAQEIERSLDFLTTSLRNVPERHRSLRVVFEQSWQRLSAAEQAVLRQLSVFRGGCTREAATQVTGATLTVLSALVDKALLRRTASGRYELHELIRQFAEAQLQTDPDAVAEAQQRHRAYFITFLEKRTAGIKGARQQETLAEIKADIDNVRLAWRQAVADRDAAAIERSAECLFVYYLYGNGYDEGQTEFGRAVAAFAGSAGAPAAASWPQARLIADQPEELVGFLLAAQGYFLAHRHDLRRGQLLLQKALALLRRPETYPRESHRRKEAFALLWLGWALYFQDRITEARRYAEESLTFFAKSADRWGEGWSLLLLSNCTRDGRPAEAEQILKKALSTCQESGDRSVLSYCCFNLGVVARELGHYTQAQQYIDEGVQISEELDNILGLGYALFRRGQLEIVLGKYSQAIQTLQQSLAHFNEVGAVHASRARFTLGIALHLKGEHNQAAHLYAQSLAAFTVADSKLWLARCLSRLGCLAYDQGKLYQSEQFQHQSLTVLPATGQEPAITAAILYRLGEIMVAAGEHRQPEARQYFQQALELAQEHQLAPIALDVCVGLAQLLAQAGDVGQAPKFLSLAEQHEASTFETREKARQLLATMLTQAPPEAAPVAPSQERQQDLWTIVQELLTTLQREPNG